MRTLVMILFLALASGPALAEDPVATDWRGLYLGGQVGGAWGNSSWFDLGAGNIGSHGMDGAVYGGQVGYNFQNGPWVFGPEASLAWSTLSGRHLDAVFQFGPAPEYDRDKIDLVGTLTARIGYTTGPWLVYGDAGGAFAHTRYSLAGFYAPGLEFAVGDTTKWTWTIGVGGEYAFAPGWSGFLQYSYLPFGSDVATLNCTTVPMCGPPGASAVRISIGEDYHIIKTGINFLF